MTAKEDTPDNLRTQRGDANSREVERAHRDFPNSLVFRDYPIGAHEARCLSQLSNYIPKDLYNAIAYPCCNFNSVTTPPTDCAM